MSAAFWSVVAGILCATAFGSMVFFAGVVAPLVFTRLPEDVAGRFIRALFPWYYLVLGVVSGGAALAAGAAGQPGLAAGVAAVGLGFFYARQILMPRINALRDRELDGDAAAGARFRRDHRRSVLLNLGQMLALLLCLVSFLSR